MIRLLLVDDHPVVRIGLRGMLEAADDLEIVGEAGSGEEALALAISLRPDVVLMDLRMPGGLDGAAATGRIVDRLPGTRVLILTTYDTDTDILRAVEAGATGYLLKDTPIDTLIDAVRAAARGETVLAARLATRRKTTPAEQLTPRELGVLGLVARGLSNAEIGATLHLAETTVKSHVQSMLAKLGLRDRLQAAVAAYDSGLVRPGGR